jgi:transposase InsO family protein
VPALGEAAGEFGVSRKQASRLRRRFLDPLVALIENTNRPGPRRPGQASETGRRMALLTALLALARGVIVSAGIAGLVPGLREEVIRAIDDLQAKHGLAYEDAARQVGLCARTLRRWRGELREGLALAPKSRAPKHPHGKAPAELEQAIAIFAALHASDSLAHLHRRFVREQTKLCAKYGHPCLSYGAFRRCAGRSRNGADPARHTPRRGRDDPDKIPLRALALMDTSDISCFGFPFKLIPFMEAHSRSIFAHQLCDRESAARVAQVLTEGAARTGGVLGLRVDRGTPYMAHLTGESAKDQGIDMRVARAHTATDKATIERFFLTLKGALHDVFSCLDLRSGPGDFEWRKKLARTIASAVIAGYLRWGYPYIPQPHVDGRPPAERLSDAPPAGPDTISEILDRRARHHEHARTVAGELHDHYGFRWSMKRWLRAVRGYRAEDLRAAARRFDPILLRNCFHCDTKRNPRYLLAIIRSIAEPRRAQQRCERSERRRREKDETQRRAVVDEQGRRDQHPEEAALRALQFAADVFANGGFGLRVAQGWLDRALEILAQRGEDAYRLATGRFLAAAVDDDRLRRWLIERINMFKPRVTSFCTDLKL